MRISFNPAAAVTAGCMLVLTGVPCTARAWQGQMRASGQMSSPDAPSAALPNAVPASGAATGQIISQDAGQSGPAITLDHALTLARTNEPNFAAAVATSKSSQLDRSIARAALLPSVVYHNEYLYTQSNGAVYQPNSAANQGGPGVTQSSPRFISNNTVHEYFSQGMVNETVGLAQYSALAHADAAAAIASAEAEIARRGLTSTVVGLFYNSTAAQERVAIQQRAADEAQNFLKQTQQREAAREVAHADVIKAELTMQQRQRDLGDAELQSRKARLDLGVLLFPDPRSAYSVVLPATVALPARSDVDAAAANNNPEIKSAMATLRLRDTDVTSARAAYLPDLALSYSYGIDAPQFAVNGPGGVRNLGYSAAATLDIPVWDWLATQHRVKQAHIFRDAARVALTSAQRTLIAQLEEFYAEAALAHDQLDSLGLSVQTARESLRMTRLRYSAGEATVLEVVDAENSLTAAELAMQDGNIRYQVALANLQLLTGTI